MSFEPTATKPLGVLKPPKKYNAFGGFSFASPSPPAPLSRGSGKGLGERASGTYTVTVQDAMGYQSSADFTVIHNATPPTLTLAAMVQGSDVPVTWNAEDSDSNVDSSTCLLEVREDEGAWQTFSTACAGDDTYDGQPGHTYTFRLTASDNVGNANSLEVEAVVPYVKKYYYANGQRVAMRKEGVVYYLHSDHLGSTSILSDENGEQVTDSRVAYLPYGGVRLGEASTLPTDYTFTGQRLEAGLGLMHYGARFYSPRLGRFVSADTIVPQPGNPQDLNRYTYAANNPLLYTDPSGHIDEKQYKDAMDIIEQLQRDYGVIIDVDFGWQPVPNPAPGEPTQVWTKGAWEFSELETVSQAVGDLAGVMGGAEAFRSALGETKIAKGFTGGNAGLTWTANYITLADNPSKWTVVHELAHTWDAASFGELSRGLEEFTRGKTRRGKYDYGGVPPKGADQNFNRSEDFAESVTTFVYPGKAQAFIQSHFQNQPQFHYENYYQTRRALYVARQLNMDPREFRLWRYGQ